MYDHVTKVHHQPAFARFSLHAALLFVMCLGRFQHAFGERIQHTVAGAVAKNKIVGEVGNPLDVKEQDVFALFVLQGFDDFMGKFECVQVSPLDL